MSVDPTGLHGRPTAEELLDAVRGFLEGLVERPDDPRTAFHARVAARVVAMVERELADDGAAGDAHRERLAGLGYDDDRSLAAAIRSGELDGRWAEVRSVVEARTAARLAVANPSYASDRDGRSVS